MCAVSHTIDNMNESKLSKFLEEQERPLVVQLRHIMKQFTTQVNACTQAALCLDSILSVLMMFIFFIA